MNPQLSVDELAAFTAAGMGGHEPAPTLYPEAPSSTPLTWAKAADFIDTPEQAAAVHAATIVDKQHYLRDSLIELTCRACHSAVLVKKSSQQHTSVQWNNKARSHCLTITSGSNSSDRSAFSPIPPSCPRLTASIQHAVAEGIFNNIE